MTGPMVFLSSFLYRARREGAKIRKKRERRKKRKGEGKGETKAAPRPRIVRHCRYLKSSGCALCVWGGKNQAAAKRREREKKRKEKKRASTTDFQFWLAPLYVRRGAAAGEVWRKLTCLQGAKKKEGGKREGKKDRKRRERKSACRNRPLPFPCLLLFNWGGERKGRKKKGKKKKRKERGDTRSCFLSFIATNREEPAR